MLRRFTSKIKLQQKLVKVHFITPEQEKITIDADIGKNILEVAHENDIELEGACEQSLACSTCHVYVEGDYFDKIPEACEEEEDMLDMAFALKENSRLGCQIVLTEELDGIVCRMPNATRNIQLK